MIKSEKVYGRGDIELALARRVFKTTRELLAETLTPAARRFCIDLHNLAQSEIEARKLEKRGKIVPRDSFVETMMERLESAPENIKRFFVIQ